MRVPKKTPHLTLIRSARGRFETILEEQEVDTQETLLHNSSRIHQENNPSLEFKPEDTPEKSFVKLMESFQATKKLANSLIKPEHSSNTTDALSMLRKRIGSKIPNSDSGSPSIANKKYLSYVHFLASYWSVIYPVCTLSYYCNN